MNTRGRWLILLLIVGSSGCGPASSTTPSPRPKQTALPVAQTGAKDAEAADRKVLLVRTPDSGIQPQAIVYKGVLHLIYFKGDPKHGDVFYVYSRDDGKSFSKPLSVNSHADSVIAGGNVRGAHLAVGTNGRVHVAWMGSMKAEPKAAGNAMPMLYARLNDGGTAFEPQRNLIERAVGLDGGGSIAAEGDKVIISWHAPALGTKGEEQRRVWLRTSLDGGVTFSGETPISPPDTGACGCCGMRVFAGHPTQPLVLYRGARELIHRDMYLLVGAPGGGDFAAIKLQEWETGTCPMSTMAFASGAGETLLAWETEGQVSYARLRHGAGKPSAPIAAPGPGGKRRHPAIAGNGRETLFAWTEGMGWNKGGALAWQIYDGSDQPMMNQARAEYGRADGVPTWSVITAVALGDGRFLIVH